MYYLCAVAKLNDDDIVAALSVCMCTFVPEIFMETNFHHIILLHEKSKNQLLTIYMVVETTMNLWCAKTDLSLVLCCNVTCSVLLGILMQLHFMCSGILYNVI